MLGLVFLLIFVFYLFLTCFGRGMKGLENTHEILALLNSMARLAKRKFSAIELFQVFHMHFLL